MKICNAVFMLLLFASFSAAEENPKIPLITVTGTYELNVTPDEIKIIVDIDNREKLLQTAKEKTDEQAKKLIAIAKTHQIPAVDVITSYVAMAPVRNFRKSEGREISYFQAAQRITIKLHDFSKYDPLMNSMINEGFGDASVVYDVLDMPSYRKKARVGAILAAQEKAKLLAEAIGQKIGKAYSIKEDNQKMNMPSPSNSEFRYQGAPVDIDNSSLSIGNIVVKVSVEASFYLE
jgi:uncharacterized protein